MQQNNKMRILHIITRLDKGGSAENTLQTVAHLGPERSFLLTGKTYDPEGNIKRFIEEKKINCIIFPELVREISFFCDVQAFIKIFLYIKKNKFDIVHTHSSKAGMLGRWAAWMAGTKTIIHTPHGHVFYGYFGKLKSSLFVFFEKITAFITDKIITLTEKGIKDHVKFGIAPREKFIAIPSGINTRDFKEQIFIPDKKRELGILEDKIVVGTVSRLDPIKGNKYFIKAIKEIKNKRADVLKNAVFLIVGDGTEGNKLRRLVKEYNIDNKVIFTGMRDDVSLIFPIIDIFVLSSLMEGMGKVLLQAMMQAKPIVATNVGGIPDIVKSGENGILVPPKNPVAIADACIKLLEDAGRRKEMGEAGKRFVSEVIDGYPRFSVELMLKKLMSLYHRLAR